MSDDATNERPMGIGYEVHGDQRGSLPVFERQWGEMLAAEAEPEFGPQERLFAEHKIEALNTILPPPPASVLECGCGSAEVSAAMAAQGYDCTLLDASPAALHVARRRFERRGLRATYTLGNVYSLPFQDNTFDILTSFGLLEHFVDVEKVIAEMVRVIKPGGMFFADIVPERFSVQTVGTVFNAGVRLAYYGMQGDPRRGLYEAGRLFRPDFYENNYPLERYRQYMRDAGLRGIVIRGNRPVPVLTLPSVIERPYVKALQRGGALWHRFDEAGTPLTNWWGAGWWAWGVKLPSQTSN
jgi:ubiquinone/menaquinone biosynthesis C-methylase UbiE